MSQKNFTRLLEEAVKHHQRGALDKAERLYLQVLELDAHQYDALNLLGVIAQQQNNFQQAVNFFNKAIASAPELTPAHINMANTLRDKGQIRDAETSYGKALKNDPESQEALLNLGSMLQAQGETEKALANFGQLIQKDPKNAKAHYNIGRCRHDQGRLDEAKESLTQALRTEPNFAEAHYALANVLDELSRHKEAVEHIKTALKLKPEWPEAYSTMAINYCKIMEFDEAIKAAELGVKLSKKSSSSIIVLAWVSQQSGDNKNAERYFSELTERDDMSQTGYIGLAETTRNSLGPQAGLRILERAINKNKTPKALNNIASMLEDRGLYTSATSFYEEAVSLDPLYLKPSYSLGYLFLRLGRFQEGWDMLSKRLDDEKFFSGRGGQTPFWRGENLDRKTILVFLEEGAGEHILQSSLIENTINNSKTCIIECARRLTPIIKRSFPKAEVISGYDPEAKEAALKRSDYQIPAINLGAYVLPDKNSFNDRKDVFLEPNKDLVMKTREKYLERAQGRRIVGISWLSGSSNHGKYKSVDLENLHKILERNEIYPVSLQYGSVAKTLDDYKNKSGTEIFLDSEVDQIKDLEIFFAQVASMDLVITVSNTTAHVAGSMGVPTWVMLPNGRGSLWFWFVHGERSPWYSSVRLFRQTALPEFGKPWWPEVVEETADALSDWLGKPLKPNALLK